MGCFVCRRMSETMAGVRGCAARAAGHSPALQNGDAVNPPAINASTAPSSRTRWSICCAAGTSAGGRQRLCIGVYMSLMHILLEIKVYMNTSFRYADATAAVRQCLCKGTAAPYALPYICVFSQAQQRRQHHSYLGSGETLWMQICASIVKEERSSRGGR